MGFIIERTHSRFGKVRPYLLTMSLPLAVSLVFLFSVPAGLGVQGKLIWIFVFYNLVTSVFFTAFNVPYSGMHNYLTDDSMERSRLSVIRLIFAFTSQMAVNAGTLALVRRLGGGSETSQAGWTGAMILFGAAAFVLSLVTFFSTRERVGSGAENAPAPGTADSLRVILRNPHLLILYTATLFSYTVIAFSGNSAVYFAKFILRNTDATVYLTNSLTAAMVLGLSLIVPVLLKHWPKGSIYKAGTLLTAAAFIASFPAARSLPVLLALNAVKGICMGATSAMTYAMSADAVDWGEAYGGIRVAGLSTALLQCIGKFGIGLGTALMGMILSAGGFAAAAETQTGSGLNALISVYTWVPGAMLLLTFAVMLFYRLDSIYPEVVRKLSERRKNS